MLSEYSLDIHVYFALLSLPYIPPSLHRLEYYIGLPTPGLKTRKSSNS